MPGTTDDRDPLEALAQCRPDRLSHERLALRLAKIGVRLCLVGQALTQGAHRLGNGGEHVSAVAISIPAPVSPVLDQVLPPPLAVVVAGGLGQPLERVATDTERGSQDVRGLLFSFDLPPQRGHEVSRWPSSVGEGWSSEPCGSGSGSGSGSPS